MDSWQMKSSVAQGMRRVGQTAAFHGMAPVLVDLRKCIGAPMEMLASARSEAWIMDCSLAQDSTNSLFFGELLRGYTLLTLPLVWQRMDSLFSRRAKHSDRTSSAAKFDFDTASAADLAACEQRYDIVNSCLQLSGVWEGTMR